MDEKKKERNDRILIVGIIVCAVLVATFFWLKGSVIGTTVVVSVDGEEYGRYSLLKEQVVQIGDTNTLVIHNHEADMLFAECPDQICVKHTPITDTDENIICLPNKVVVTIEDIYGKNQEAELDAVVK
jgi:hypothetical protein